MDSVNESAANAAAPAEQQARGRMSITAFFAGLTIAGLGHALVGYWRRGLVWLAATIAGTLLIVAMVLLRAPVPAIAALVVIVVALKLVSIGDAVYVGRRPRWRWGRWWSRAMVVCVLLVVGSWLQFIPVAMVRKVFEAFVVPTNSMLPAIAGKNLPGRCTVCGADVLLAPPPDYPVDESRDPFAAVVGICQKCGAIVKADGYLDRKQKPREGNRFLVNKLLALRRWDIIAFQAPDEPGEFYIKRLVGLPGERVEIVAGELTIDGRTIAKPSDCAYLNYVSLPTGFGFAGWGQEGKPVTLGKDEYFVLGDFSARARDSRAWETGAPGHAPYALPKDYIVGVATHIYWPVDRWRVLPRPAE